ncbi:MAG: DUF3784 domain-containing protein [Patescibacteria group bacterium]
MKRKRQSVDDWFLQHDCHIKPDLLPTEEKTLRWRAKKLLGKILEGRSRSLAWKLAKSFITLALLAVSFVLFASYYIENYSEDHFIWSFLVLVVIAIFWSMIFLAKSDDARVLYDKLKACIKEKSADDESDENERPIKYEDRFY